MISFRTRSGRRLDLEQPRPEDVDVRDIACGLSKICRFTGQLPEFYSIAQHSLFVVELVPARLRLAALFHDASEAYLTDLSRNLNHSSYLDGYRVLEDRWRVAIEARFDIHLSDADRRELKFADDLAAVYERVTVRADPPRDWNLYGYAEIWEATQEGWVRGPFEDLARVARNIPSLWPRWTCGEAELAFLTRYREIDK